MKDEIFWEGKEKSDSGPTGLEVGKWLRVSRGKSQGMG